ncbi:Ras-related RAB1BV [Chlorella sorokiniana]|uniref:Ras-related RAB1BV n=1 Tax=Chlorella sorokiniana TaxID=3076 RepID=A0A2P6TRL9_CHLSO|nr:Ras-related RAB1BV [Chlorella sorokiniana]|eukprot:PRW56705.1 Ras-related RAB1BV [Chlorella sorokiniana]
MGGSEEVQMLLTLPDGPLIHVLQRAGPEERPTLRLVCWKLCDLVDGALSPSFAIHVASHLGGRLGARPIYGSRLDFQTAAARLLARRADGLTRLELDFDAHGCVFASRLLEGQPLPLLRSAELQNVEAQHLAVLRTLPRLRELSLSRHVNGLVSAGPAAELLVAQLAGLPLHRLSLAGYRMLPGLLGSVAEALPTLRQLALGVEQVEGSGRLELAALPRLLGLQQLDVRVLPGRASAPDVTLAPLPADASCLIRLTSLALLHVRPGQGEEEALWGSLAHLPALQQLRSQQSGHAVLQPPAQLLRLETLTSLHVKIDGAIYSSDPAGSTWTQLPELPEGALPRLARLHLDCVGLLGLPASWCRLPLRELRISGLASERAVYQLSLPEELAQLAASLERLELPRCGLRALPEQVAALSSLTCLDLSCNSVVRLPDMGKLRQLRDLNLFSCPATNAASALQTCTALRRLVLGTRHYAVPSRRATLDGGPLDGSFGAAYEDEEASRITESAEYSPFVDVSRKNVFMLLLTRGEVDAMASTVLPALEEHCGVDYVSSILHGCFGVLGATFSNSISDTNPFARGKEYAYKQCGRNELQRLRDTLLAARGKNKLERSAAGEAVHRKRVLLGWALNFDAFMASHGIRILVHNLGLKDRAQQVGNEMDPPCKPQSGSAEGDRSYSNGSGGRTRKGDQRQRSPSGPERRKSPSHDRHKERSSGGRSRSTGGDKRRRSCAREKRGSRSRSPPRAVVERRMDRLDNRWRCLDAPPGPAAMAAASHAAISKKNMGELLLTKPELEGAVVALQALQEHRGPDFVSNLLAGCYVRIRRNKQPVLLVLLGLHLGPQGQPLIRIEGIAQPRGAIVLSHANPFTDPEEYEKCGRQELLQLMQELRAAGQPPGIDMAAAARAVWHKKVLLGWAAHWQEFMAEHGINKLVGDLQDSNKMAREATFLEPMPTSMPAAQQHPQPAPQQPPQPQQPQQPQQQEPAQQQPQQHVVQQPMHAVHQPMQAVQQPQQPQAGANVPQQHAQQPAAQVPQPQPMARVQAHLPAGQPLQQQIASLAVQPPQQAVPLVQQADVPAGMVHQQQQVAAFFRAAYPSVHSARVVEAAGGVPHHAIVNFGAIWERDAALSKMDGSWFDGRCLAVRLPGQPLALPPQQAQQAQQAPPEFRAYVNGLPPTMDEVAAADFFRQRYPSVLGVRLWPPARDQPATSVQRGHILFAREDERDAAVREENGQILEGNKLKVELPLEEKAVLGVQSPRSPQQQRPQRPPSFNLFVDGLPPDATAESVATLFG